MNNVIIAPSILAADFANLEKDIKLVESLGAKYLHFDVMDGHFVENISFGIPVLKKVSKIHNMVNDVHLMISNPMDFVDKFKEAGADVLTFHYEACTNVKQVDFLIYLIKKYGMKVGISIKPKTNVDVLYPYLDQVDQVLLMSVEPGFGGQEFLPEILYKIRKLKTYIKEKGLKTLIEIDGGINAQTGKACIDAGADILVAGTYLFGKEDIKERYERLAK